MRETLYKFEVKIYHTGFYKDHSELSECQNQKKLEEDYYLLDGVKNRELSFADGKKKKDAVFFTFTHSSAEESDFEKNYGNPLTNVSRRNFLVVVEKENNKVTFKRFSNVLYRKVGKPYFQKNSRVDYISYNTDTKFIYQGFIVNYHKKKKASKSVRKNFFAKNILNSFLIEMKNSLYPFKGHEPNDSLLFDSTKIFTSACGLKDDLVSKWDDIIYKEYLDKMGIKYPNNFSVFRTTNFEHQPKLKEIRKMKMRLVDAFMKKNNLSGKVLKKALHDVEKLNLNFYKHSLRHLGPDIINNDYELTKACLEYSEEVFLPSSIVSVKDIFSGQEFNRVLKVFRDIVFNKILNFSSFLDHIRYYVKLKYFGEPIKWRSETAGTDFHQEHLDWADKISQYEIGFYERIYPDMLEKICCVDIINNGITYKPILLKNTTEYNEESQTQSNCVKTYIGHANAIIFSIRKNGEFSNERATIEYTLKNIIETDEIVANNVQSRIKYNGNPTEEWMNVINELDKRMYSYVKSKYYKNVKLKKTCKNGVVLETESYWDDSFLSWKKSDINEKNFYYG